MASSTVDAAWLQNVVSKLNNFSIMLATTTTASSAPIREIIQQKLASRRGVWLHDPTPKTAAATDFLSIPAGNPNDPDAEYEMQAEDEDVELGDDADSEMVDEAEVEALAETHPEEEHPDQIRLNATAIYLPSLTPYIQRLHSTPPIAVPPQIRITPETYQLVAAAKVQTAAVSPLRLLLVADPPGFGKTLVVIMVALLAAPEAKGPTFVVVPPSCLIQWGDECEKFLQPWALNVMIMTDSKPTAEELLQYDLVVVSYNLVMSQFRRRQRFLNDIKDFQAARRGGIVRAAPSYPNLALCCDIFKLYNIKFPYLGLDEVNIIKNPKGVTCRALHAFSQYANATVMLTGDPIDNTYEDLWTLTKFLKGHPFDTLKAFKLVFGTPDPRNSKAFISPRGRHLIRLVQFMNAWIIRRPESLLSLPPRFLASFRYTLTRDEAASSNEFFRDWVQAMARATINLERDHPNSKKLFGILAKALEHASHPRLCEIMTFLHNFNARTANSDYAENEADMTDEQKHKQLEWREDLAKDENWRSSKIDAIVNLYNRARDIDPDVTTIIFAEMVHFLDIVEIAFTNMDEPVKCLRFDGRKSAVERAGVLAQFRQNGGVLLMTRASGALGLNIACANYVIITEPLWNKGWEFQAFRRVWRKGQRREVHVDFLLACNSSAEIYKANRRDTKYKDIKRILGKLTRHDGRVPPQYQLA